MNNFIASIILTLFCAQNVSSQVVVDDSLSWGSSSQVLSQTSPDFEFCNQSLINYQISTTSSCGFRNINATSNGSIPNGVIFPAITNSCADNQIEISISFNQPIDNLRIKLVDLDEDANPSLPNPEESVTSFSIPPSNLVQVVGQTNWTGNSAVPDGNNTTIWLEWDSQLSGVSFIYNRPGTAYGLIIGEVMFSCDSLINSVSPAPCEANEVHVPNVFTPNYDLVNDLFAPLVDSCLIISNFYILNRWGEQVFSSDLSNPVWTGETKNGKELSEGIYFWVIEYYDPNGAIFKKHGNVTLIR